MEQRPIKPELDELVYRQMQLALVGALTQAIRDGADGLTLAHAVAPIAVELLLGFHPPEAVETIFHKQVAIISADREADEAVRH